ncbi:MAG: hypothetical protein U0T32_00830 [Chitinophagales bacterium]
MRHYSVLLLLVLFLGCKKDQKTEWDTELLTPIGRTSLSIENLIKDSLAKANGDNTVNLTYRSTIYELNLADQLIRIPDTSLKSNINVSSLVFSEVRVTYNASLGTIANTLKQSTDATQQFIGNYLISNQGNNAVIAPINGLAATPFLFDASSYFQSIELEQGKLRFYVVNHLPIAITDVHYEARNAISNSLVLAGTVPNSAPFIIPPYDSVYVEEDLAGKTLEGSLKFQITSFNSPGSNGVPVKIDTNDYIGINAAIANIVAKKAIARFPSQDLISSDQEITQTIGERKFTYVDCKSGELGVDISSSIQEKLRITYRLKNAYNKNGKVIEDISDVAPSVGGVPTTISKNFDLSGFSIGLTGSKGNNFNTYTQVVVAHIDSSGILREITNSDSLYFTYRLKNIKPNYIKGYAGRDTILFQGNSPFSFSNLFAGNAPNALDFQDVSLSLNIENGLGVDGIVKINTLSGKNANGNIVSLQDNSASPVIGQPLSINRAQDFPLRPAKHDFQINSATSNIKNFLTNLPSSIDYDVQIRTNPNGNQQTYDDFAYLDSRLKVNLDLNIPLSVKANNLTLRDTFGFKLGNSPKEIDNINSGTLYLITYNKFPLKGDVSLVVYDSLNNPIDTLLSNYTLVPGDVDGNCRVNEAKKNVFSIPVSSTRIHKLFSGYKAVLTAVFNTQTNNGTCNGQYYKIYSDYKLDAKITAQFNYKVKL